MCCRYYMEESPELRPFTEAAKRSPLTEKLVAKLARPLTVSPSRFRRSQLCNKALH